jgi:site-specific DNA recombinase
VSRARAVTPANDRRPPSRAAPGTLEEVERKVEDLYRDRQIDSKVRSAFERTLIIEFESIKQESAKERERLLKRQQRLLGERDKLLQAHYAEAIPLDLLKTEQDRIRTS